MIALANIFDTPLKTQEGTLTIRTMNGAEGTVAACHLGNHEELMALTHVVVWVDTPSYAVDECQWLT